MSAAVSRENLNTKNTPLFTPEERKTLLERASEYFRPGSPALLRAVHRNKTKEYFDKIREEAKSTGVEVMRGYFKNATGHEQNGINWNLEGTFFGTTMIRGQLPQWSPFGDTRLTVDADYLIPPDQSILFFADFCCHRKRRDERKKHMVILVLCQRGTDMEHKCRQKLQLIELNLFDNPFLRVRKHETSPSSFIPTFAKQTYTYYVTTTINEDSINIFHAGDFNITKALEARKCRFSTIETSDRGYVERRGLEPDRRCTICNIFPIQDQNNNSLERLDLGTGQWRLWTYICTDLPRHCCPRVNKNAKIRWPIDHEIEKICAKQPELPAVISFDQWKNYIREGKLFQNAAGMIECIRAKGCFVPSTLCRNVFFAKQLGMAFFREGISPDYDCPMNRNGGYFQLRLLCRKNDHSWASTLDQMFHQFMDFLLHRLSPEMAQMVNGTFVRCEISNDYKPEDSANNFEALPILFKIELWIRDKAYKLPFENALTNWSQDVRFTNFMAKNFAQN